MWNIRSHRRWSSDHIAKGSPEADGMLFGKCVAMLSVNVTFAHRKWNEALLFDGGGCIIHPAYVVWARVLFHRELKLIYDFLGDNIHATSIVDDDVEDLTLIFHSGMKNISSQPTIMVGFLLSLVHKILWMIQSSIFEPSKTSSVLVSFISLLEATHYCSSFVDSWLSHLSGSFCYRVGHTIAKWPLPPHL